MADADFFTKITESIWNMIIVYNPEFERVGRLIFSGLVVYRVYDFLKTTGFRGTGDGFLEDLFNLLEVITVGLVIQVFYQAPIPGVGVSFTKMVTGTTSSLARTLDAGLVMNIYHHFQAIQDSFIEPGWTDILMSLLYFLVVVWVLLAKALTVALVGLSLIFSALAVLVGPVFTPWILLPSLSGWFFSWFRSLVQWSFLQVSAYGYLFLFENYMRGYLTSLPTDIPPEGLQTYGMQAVVVAIIFLVGIVFIGVFNAGLFSGGNSPTVFDHSPIRRYV